MDFAEVAVNSPVFQPGTFTYAIPRHTEPKIGQAVWVPFGPRVLQGIVFQLTDHTEIEDTREIIGVIDPIPVLSPLQIELANWISDYYLAPLFEAAGLMLPPGFERKLVTFLRLSREDENLAAASFTPEQKQMLKQLGKEEKVTLGALEKAFGKRHARTVVGQLLRKGLVTKSEEMEGLKAKPKFTTYLKLAVATESARQEIRRIKRAPKQVALLEFLMSNQFVSLKKANQIVDCSPATVKALEQRGMISREQVQLRRNPVTEHGFSPTEPPTLNAAQDEALSQIKVALRQSKKESASIFLLHGVTGSGKTEIYLGALSEAIAAGKRGIVLVPEIALTVQTIQRFASRFPNRVALLHSQLSPGEQFDEWYQIREGAFDVVIGPRSALFSPQPDLGLIIIDEEHEGAYKQQEQSPRYHVREAALKLAELSGAVVILGSATPDIESYYRAEEGRYHLLQLPCRVTRGIESPLPQAELVDMRQELREGNRSIFSGSLKKAIAATLAEKEQVILFLNRRGTSTFVQCRNCGYVIKCPRCELPLTYHTAEEILTCHQCNYRKATPEVCPECESRRIKFLGTGTQRVEEEVARNFPGAKVLRWDRDVTRKKNSHERIMNKFSAHQADILVGTQMIAKGLDIPSVTLVGIISADTILRFPDFRAAERTFQLLCQVAGRAGRGQSSGKVIVQTYTPDHYAISAGSRQDYAAFYRREIGYRWQYNNPPFSRLACLIYHNTNNDLCRRETERVYQKLKKEIDSRGIPGTTLIGPSPMFFPKVRGRYRWHIIVRGSNPAGLLAGFLLPQGWIVEIDPVSLL
ncbi:primosomal protein N' [Chloroflexota bacterium]